MSLMTFKRKMSKGMSFLIIQIVLIRTGSQSNIQMLISKRNINPCLKRLKIKATIMATLMRTTTVMVTVKATLVIKVLITTISPRLCHTCSIRLVMEDTANRQAAPTWPMGSKASHIMSGMCECDLMVIVSNYRQDRQETTSRLATKQTNQLWTFSKPLQTDILSQLY